MILNEVVSSNIKKIGWEDDVLAVEYSGGVYNYKGVTKELYEQLMQAESKGKFVNSNIKGKYEYEKTIN